MKSLFLFAGAAGLLSAPAAMAADLVSPQFGVLQARESVSFNGGPATEGAPGFNTWTNTPPVGPITVGSTLNRGPVDITTSTTGTYASATAGSVAFQGSMSAGDNDGVPFVAQYPADVWSYSFVTNADATFTLNFDLSGSGSQVAGTGLWGLVITDEPNGDGVIELNNGVIGFTDGATEASGSITVHLLAGQDYELGLADFDTLTQGHSSVVDTASFSWTITSAEATAPGVPEPAAWALMILGFGAAGVSLRRRRRAVAA